MKIKTTEKLKNIIDNAIKNQLDFLNRMLNSPSMEISKDAKRDIEILTNIKQKNATNNLEVSIDDMPSLYLCIYNYIEDNGINSELKQLINKMENEFRKETKFDIKIASGIWE